MKGAPKGSKVPFVMRMAVTDSAAACLCMVLAFHGKRIPLAQARAIIGSQRGGVTPEDVAVAASSFQIEAEIVDPLTPVNVPLIVRWRYRDFVVMEGRGRRGVTIVDPAIGRLRVTPEELAAGATGPAVLLTPSAEFERTAGRPLSWRRYLELTPRRLLISVFSFSLVLRLLALLLPALTAFVVDRVIPDGDLSLLGLLGFGLGAFLVVQVGSSLVRQVLLVELGQRLDRVLMQEFFDRLLRLPLRFFQIRSSGDILMHVNSNAVIRNMLSNQVLGVLLDALLATFYVVLMFAFYAPLAVLVTGLGVVQTAFAVLATRTLYYYSQRSLLAQTILQGYVVEILSGMATLKVAGAEGTVMSRWQRLFDERLKASLSQQRMAAWLYSLIRGFGNAAPLLLLVVGAALVIEGDLTLGQMLGFNALAAAFLGPLASIGGVVQQLQAMAVHLSRLDDVLDELPEQTGPPRHTLQLRGHLEVRNVAFRYDTRGPDVLCGIDFMVMPGETLGIVGPTGSGKSTLARILAGLHLPTAGEVRYDGVLLSELDWPSLRRQMGVVLQETFLFQNSIRENIALHDPELSPEAICEAAAMAAVEDDIAALPLGFETHLGELGNNLSGGQRQRLCLARALAHTPAVLILDEATSHLDTVTEALVFERLEQLHVTRILIAHRLSTIRRADRILVLDRGRIAEHGTHQELLDQGGLYQQLFMAQTSMRP